MENWKPIPFLRHLHYEVSDLGNVRNTWTGKVLKPFNGYGKNGKYYKKVNLYDKGRRYSVFIHRLVAFAFYEIDHRDRDRSSNSITNLEPVLRKENDSRWRMVKDVGRTVDRGRQK